MSRGFRSSTGLKLNPDELSSFLKVNTDLLTVRYVGTGSHPNDVGAIQTKQPFLVDQLVSYFEVTILECSEACNVAVGVGDCNFRNNRAPGQEPSSYGYHGIDGRRMNSSIRGDEYGPCFGAGDVVGCGIVWFPSHHRMFFTLNGRHLGDAFTVKDSAVLYPTVSLHSVGELIKCNFGSEPFSFDLDGFTEEQRFQVARDVKQYNSPPFDVSLIVRQYLKHCAYTESLRAFEAILPPPTLPPPTAFSLSSSSSATTTRPADPLAMFDARTAIGSRREVLEHIGQGQIAQAREILEQLFPAVLSDNLHASVRLSLQQFIEYIRSNQLDAAVSYCRTTLKPLHSSLAFHRHALSSLDVVEISLVDGRSPTPPFSSYSSHTSASSSTNSLEQEEDTTATIATATTAAATTKATATSEAAVDEDRMQVDVSSDTHPHKQRSHLELLSDALALLAYESPSQCPALSYLLDASFLKETGDIINAAMLDSCGVSSSSSLETLLKQLYVTQKAAITTQGGRGEVFTLRNLGQYL